MSDDWEFSTEKFATEKYIEVLRKHESNMTRNPNMPIMDIELYHWRQIFKSYLSGEQVNSIHKDFPNADKL